MRKNKLKARDTGEIAAWISDDDPTDKLKWWREEEVPRLFKESAEANGVKLGPVSWYELKPGEGRAGAPPAKVRGTNVRLLVAECDVVGTVPIPVESRFTDDLTHDDLLMLRESTRRAYGRVLAADGVSTRELRDDECDKIINLVGPEAAAKEALHATKH